MYKLGLLLLGSLLLLSTISVLCCGSGHGELKGITVSPPTAAGQAQFTATGVYSDGTKVSQLPVLWSQGNPWVMSDLATEGIVVSSSGMASCEPVVGTFMVQATAPVDPHIPVSQMVLTTQQVHGTARLSCP